MQTTQIKAARTISYSGGFIAISQVFRIQAWRKKLESHNKNRTQKTNGAPC